MGNRSHRLTPLAGLGAGVTLVLAAIAGPTGAITAGATTLQATSLVAARTAAVKTTTVTVAEEEFTIVLSRKTFTAGRYTFMVANRGKLQHNLMINGPGVNHQGTRTLNSGQSGSVTVTLKRGSYELWCSVDGHKELGMDLKIKVT